jgi:FKBP-type peptidyl-prolyl cis-trans isomerase 2
MNDTPGRARKLTKGGAVAVALLLIGAALVGYAGYQYFTSSKAVRQLTVQNGDSVLLNYIGQYTNGQVFDTSLYSVAVNNGSYVKGPGFQWRGNASSYTPLNVSDVGTGQVIKGMDQGIIGMHVNETKTLVIPPSEGYGPLNPSLLEYLPIYQNITIVHTMNSTAFSTAFGQKPIQGQHFIDPFWHWTDFVVYNSSTSVTYDYTPDAGQTVYPYTYNSTVQPGYYGWPVKVLSIDSGADNGTGRITLYNEISPSMVKSDGGRNETSSTFTVWSLNSNGTATLNFNRPVVGRTLIFTVTLTYIYNPGTGRSVGTPSYSLALPERSIARR